MPTPSFAAKALPLTSRACRPQTMRTTIQTILLLLLVAAARGQCTLYDGQGTASTAPVWVSCTGGSYTVFIQSPVTYGAMSIDWGDGSGLTNVASLVPPAFVSHTYAAAISNYTVTVTSGACTITGLVVMEEPVNASIQIPVGGVTQTCAPDELFFTNSSTDVSSNTTFIWNFGDGSPALTFGDTNAGQTVGHTYLQGTVNCVTQVTLSAENYCSFGNPTTASFNPIQIFDIDDAQITASSVLLCYPDTVVHFANTTAKNCVPQGNTAQRFEYWNFGDYWGQGTDSIVDWAPFDPPAKPGYDIAFPGIGTYTIMMADSNLCGADTAFITVQITTPPTAGILVSVDSACTGEAFTFTNGGAGGNQYLINYGAGGGFAAFGATASHSYGVAGTYTVTTVANITGGSASCTDTASLTVVVLPSPNASVSLSPAGGCDSATVAFINASSGASTYAWNFGNGNTSTLQNPPPITYTTVGQTTVSLTVTSNNGCTATDQSTVSVYDVPVAAFAAANVCEDALAAFSDASTVGFGGPVNSWLWQFGDPLMTTAMAQNPNFTYVDSGTYVVTLVASTATCTDTVTDTILVEPRPTAIFSLSDTLGCSPLTVSATNASVFGSSFLWTFGDGNTATAVSPTHTFVHAAQTDTTFAVKLLALSAFGCADSTTATVTVLGNPIADFSHNAVLDCAPLEVQFTDASQSAVSWNWNFGDSTGSVVQHPAHTFDNTSLFITNYTVQMVVSATNGCTDTLTDLITVYPEPLFSFSIVPDSGCSPLAVQFPVAVGAVIYNWDFGDGNTSTGSNPQHTFVNNTTNNAQFLVTLIATTAFGCVDTVVGSATVFPKPTAALSPATSAGCQPLSVSFTNGSIGGTSYDWDFGDGSSSTSTNASLAHSFANTTADTLFFTPTLIASTPDGCSDTATVTVSVYKQIVADFAGPAPDCHPYTVPFADGSTNADSWAWNFGDGNFSAVQNPSHVYINSGTSTQTFTAQLTAQTVEGCTDVHTETVSVWHKPVAAVSPITTQGCQPLAVNFTNGTTGATLFDWSFGDGGTSTSGAATVAHTFINLSSDTLFFAPTLIATTANGCSDTAVVEVAVFKQIVADFAAPAPDCHPYTVAFADGSTNADSWAWDFGDGNFSSVQNPTHGYQNTGASTQIFMAELAAQTVEGCLDVHTENVTVWHKPVASITPANAQGCQPLLVNFANGTTGATVFDWSFGDGATASGAGAQQHTFVNTGATNLSHTTTMVATTTQGCTDTATTAITVYRFIEAAFDSLPSGCHPWNLNMSDASTNATIWGWNFGDGFTSAGQNPQHTFTNTTLVPAIYQVSLSATTPEGCSDTATQQIAIYPKPQANFTLNPNPVCNAEPVQIANTSVLNDVNIWTYGTSGFPAIDNTPVIDTSFLNLGSTTKNLLLNLVVETQYGCTDTFYNTLAIYPRVRAELAAVDEGCTPFDVSFSNFSVGGTLYEWQFGDGQQSFLDEPTHTFENNDTLGQSFLTVLTVTSPFNCQHRDSLAITVHPRPVAQFTANPLVQEYPDTVVTINNLTAAGPWSHLWDFGDEHTAAVEQPVSHSYTTWGHYRILLTASGEHCSDTTSLAVVIEPPLPVAFFQMEVDDCAPVEVQFTNSSLYGASYLWSFGDGAQSSTAEPIHTYQEPGTYDVGLTVTGFGGDLDAFTIASAVVVRAQPIANFLATPSSVNVPGEVVSLINYSQFADSYWWDFGDSVTSVEESPQHNYVRGGSYFITLVSSTDFGCADTFVSELPVVAIESGEIEVPNAFAPNADGPLGGQFDRFSYQNQVFFPVLDGVVNEDYTLSIFNRWGELLFETHDINIGWDGWYRNKPCQQDAYVWKIRGRFANGERFSRVGDVTIIR